MFIVFCLCEYIENINGQFTEDLAIIVGYSKLFFGRKRMSCYYFSRIITCFIESSVFRSLLLVVAGPLWAQERCRISPPRFVAECCKKRLNQASFVLLYFVLFAFLGWV